MKYKCTECGLEVKEIPKFKKNECPKDIQHYFEEQEKFAGLFRKLNPKKRKDLKNDN